MSDVVTQALSTEARAHKVLLSVEDLHTWFELRRWGFARVGFVRAVDGVDFELEQGEAVAIVGESGCGKSTLVKTVLGLQPPTKGKIVFDGEEIGPHNLRWYRSQVGYVQQDPFGALPPFMDVRRILEEPLVINGVKGRRERLERVERALDEVRLTPIETFLSKFPHMLSGGQQQRLVIARAIILQPKLIVADEPVSMLDASVRVEILQLLRKLQREHNLGVIYITHDLSTVRYFSERIFVMYGAKLIEEAGVNELVKNPLHPYTRALLNAIPDPDPANAEVMKEVPPGEPPSLLNPPSGCRFHPRCPEFMPGLCDLEEPPDFEPEPRHFAACWLYREER
jgi:peptide/nickel transport system ATP-binding protein